MGPSLSTREETVLVQRRREFGSMIRVCVRAKKEIVCVLLGTQYGSQCEYKRGDYFGSKEAGIWVNDKGLRDSKEREFMDPAGDANMGPSVSTRDSSVYSLI